MTEVLTLKYRPTQWKDVVGQGAIVRSLKGVIAAGSNKTFLLSGPSGTGKTTLARIAAKEIGCEGNDIVEIDAATYTSIDDMRKVIQTLPFRTLSGRPRVIILDEVHRLSGPAFAALLKSLEEPPAHVWWFLCTTDPVKVPAAIQTRCTKYSLSSVSKGDLRELLDDIVASEKIAMGADHDGIVDLCVKEAQGSPRAAIVNLGACLEAQSKEEARTLLKSAAVGGAAIDLARALAGTADWDMVQEILVSLKDENPESVRHVVRQYMTTAILKSKKTPSTKMFAVLEAFSVPFASTDGLSPLVLACGGLLLGGGG